MRKTLIPAAGIAMIAAAAMLTNRGIEHALLGTDSGALQYGPALFRALLALHGLMLVVYGLMPHRRKIAPIEFAPPGAPGSATAWIVVVMLCLIATALRLYRLDTCMWIDEILSFVDFIRPPASHIIASFPNQNQHMLYSLAAHGCLLIFGQDAAAARVPAVLFGVGSLVAVYLLGRRLFSQTEALLACAFMTVSYHHVWFSQSARGYTGLLFFATLAVWFWIEAHERGGGWWFWYVLAMTLGLWIHMTMIFVLAAQGVVYAASLLRPMRPDGRKLNQAAPVIAWLLCGTIVLQFCALSLPEFLRSARNEISLPSDWTSPVWLVSEAVRSAHLGPMAYVAIPIGGLIFLAGWVSLFRRQPSAAVQMMLAPLMGGVAMLVLAHNLWPRFFFFAMGFMVLLAFHGLAVTAGFIVSLAGAPRMAQRAVVVIGCLVIAGSCFTLPRCYALPKQDFTGPRDFIEQSANKADARVALGLAGLAYQKLYAPQWQFPQEEAGLEQITASHRKTWVATTLPIEMSNYHANLWKLVQARFELVRSFPGTLGGGDVCVWRSR